MPNKQRKFPWGVEKRAIEFYGYIYLQQSREFAWFNFWQRRPAWMGPVCARQETSGVEVVANGINTLGTVTVDLARLNLPHREIPLSLSSSGPRRTHTRYKYNAPWNENKPASVFSINFNYWHGINMHSSQKVSLLRRCQSLRTVRLEINGPTWDRSKLIICKQSIFNKWFNGNDKKYCNFISEYFLILLSNLLKIFLTQYKHETLIKVFLHTFCNYDSDVASSSNAFHWCLRIVQII